MDLAHSFGDSSIWIEEQVKPLIESSCWQEQGCSANLKIQTQFPEVWHGRDLLFHERGDFQISKYLSKPKDYRCLQVFSKLYSYLIPLKILYKLYKQLLYQNGNKRVMKYWRLEKTAKSGGHQAEPTQRHLRSGFLRHFVNKQGSEHLHG